MSQQWQYRAVEMYEPSESSINAKLAQWADAGWELVNGSFSDAPLVGIKPTIWLFWRKAK